MSLHVEASLDRNTPIYLAGEDVSVQVVIRNDGQATETLAWGSVQLTSDRTRSGRRKTHENATTAISSSPHNVFHSAPVVIFCDLHIACNETRSFSCTLRLPLIGVPPTFRGHLIRFGNKLTVAVARICAPIRTLSLPMRVLLSVGLPYSLKRPALLLQPFLAGDEWMEASVCQLVTAEVDKMTAARRPLLFALTNSSGKVANLTLFKKTFRLGEDVVGEVSFSDCSPCLSTLQFTVVLETVESLTDSDELPSGEGPIEPHVTLQAHDEQVCYSLEGSFFRLSIPMNAPPSFHFDISMLKWRLRFEFVTTSTSREMETHEEEGASCQAPESAEVERLSWQTDIFVLPCTPQNAALTDSTLSNSLAISL